MSLISSMKLSIICGVIVILIIGFIVPSTVADINIYLDDQVWEDTFDNPSIIVCEHCEVTENDEIVLTQTESGTQYYNFNNQSNHLAYDYSSIIFFPMLFSPKYHIIWEHEYLGRDKISLESDNNYYTNHTTNKYYKYGIQHFRFKIGISKEFVKEIHLQWNGKTDSNTIIYFYYWNSSRFHVGAWNPLKYNKSDAGNDVDIDSMISEGDVKYALDDNDYIDISIVIYSPFFNNRFTLSTDFIQIVAETKAGFWLKDGYAKTKDPIDLKNISTRNSTSYWDFLTWDDYQPEGTNASYQVLYESSINTWTAVENTTLPGNGKGFTKSPVYLNNLSKREFNDKYNRLKIRVKLKTDDPSVTPHIYSWAITWQNETGWRDSFNTNYKIDQRTKIGIDSGSLRISLFQDEWPLFGFNSENTRASNGTGPTTNNIFWYSREYVGGEYRNPIIGDGKVYILSKQSLHVYNMKIPAGSRQWQNNILSKTFKDVVFVNSPALAENLVIVATGQQAQGGTDNFIYALRKDNLTIKWDFDYQDKFGEKICYTASPVIAENTIFISTWGGDNGTYALEKNRYTNNKLIALDLDSGAWKWEYELPAASFSTPAVTSDMVIVGCSSTDNDSIFAIPLSGGHEHELWKRSVGSIGHSSPVIYGNTVFVTCEEVNLINLTTNVKIRALNLKDGKILWNRTIGEFSIINQKSFADSTPTVYNNILYVASPNGSLYAINTANGSIRWTQKIYSYLPIISPDLLISSPAYANKLIYIGTPAGKILGIDATNGKEIWNQGSFDQKPVLGSPIVSNGLVFITDEGEYLYSIGKFLDNTIEGSAYIISHPIRLPENLWWKSFHANVLYNNDYSNIKFQLLDENKNVLKNDLKNGTILSNTTLPRTLRLRADFTTNDISANNPRLLSWEITLVPKDATPPYFSPTTTPIFNGIPVHNISIKVRDKETGLINNSAEYTIRYIIHNETFTFVSTAHCTGENETTEEQTITVNLSKIPNFNNITSLVSIKFTIKDFAKNEAKKIFSFPSDTVLPYFSSSTTPPFTGKPVSKISIKVRDNQTGLLVNSATYTLQYVINNNTLPYTSSAQCTGLNGTKQEQNISINLSKIANFDQITSLISIKFSVLDCAENEATKSFLFDSSTTPPYLYPSTTPPFTGKPVSKISIKVRDNQTGLLINSATYTLQYVINNNTLPYTSSAQCTGLNGTTQVQNITANLSKIPNYSNITSLISIKFSIKDLAQNEATKTFSVDTKPPYLYPSTTPPFTGKPVSKISIKVIDNQTGLLVNSATYTLQYVINNKTLTNKTLPYTSSAQCTGLNGTTQIQDITANLSKIPNYSNITSLTSIEFSIKDIAGNKATKSFKSNISDITAPNSYILTESIKPRYNASTKFIWINASSFDNGTTASGIQQVKLYYRYSSTGSYTGDWKYFANSTQNSPHWKFNFTNNPSQHGGYFEICTIAIDKAGNTENYPTKGDISFLYDWTKPTPPSIQGDIIWFKERLISLMVFEDDFRLDTIQYRPSSEYSWTTIATDINTSTYDTPWSLKEEYWNLINEGEVYNLFFKINDTLGNTLLTTNEIRKDTVKPIGNVEIKEPILSYNFTVIGLANDQNGSGIKEISLYYRFSEDKSNWSSWTSYGDILISPPFQWNFSAQDGDGYYEFQINVTDVAGNTIKSEVLSASVFPTSPTLPLPVTLILVMISLLLVLSLLSAIIFIKWRKTKAT